MNRVEVTIAIGKDSRTFVLFRTNAPPAYDYGGVIVLTDLSYEGTVERYALVPREAAESQRLRNASGLHTFETDLLLDERDVAHYLWQRFYPEA